MYFKVVRLRGLFLPLMCIAFILCLIGFSKAAVAAAARGLHLWFEIVFPSLFPFFVASYILNGTGFIRAAGILLEPVMRPLFNVPGCGSFAFAMGITSGYPVGAKITSGMRQQKLLSKTEAERLLAFSNNSGPLFIIGAVSVGMFKMPELGLFLLGCHIAACITVGFLFRFYRGKGRQSSRNLQNSLKSPSGRILSRMKKELLNVQTGASFGAIFGNAVRDAVMMLLAIGGFIVLFSVIINLLLETGVISRLAEILTLLLAPAGIGKELVEAVLSGIFEITTGINMASAAQEMPLAYRLAATSFIAGWAGLSVHAQVYAIISETDISIKPYLFGKLLQGLLASIYTIAGLRFLNTDLTAYLPVFDIPNKAAGLVWLDYLAGSGLCIVLFLAVILVFYLAARAINLAAGIFISIRRGLSG